MIAAAGLPVQLATRVLGVSESGFNEWKGRPPSARAMGHAWLSDQIRAVLGGLRVRGPLATCLSRSAEPARRLILAGG